MIRFRAWAGLGFWVLGLGFGIRVLGLGYLGLGHHLEFGPEVLTLGLQEQGANYCCLVGNRRI